MKFAETLSITAIAFASLAYAAAAPAQQSQSMPGMDMKQSAPAAQANEHHASGTVKSVNREKGTVSIAHGAIASLNWPAMTMTFKASPEMLEALKPGSPVDFSFVQSGRNYTITSIE